MPPRLLLDGEDLRSLMLRVRDEMGPGARIVKAERVRTGGVGGFFAKERYELTIEVPDQPGPRARPTPTGARPAAGGERALLGMDALLAAAEAEERAAASGTARGAGAPSPGPPAPGGPAGAGATDPGATAEPPRDPDLPVVSTDGETFAEVLESVTRLVAEPEPEPAPEPAPVEPATGFVPAAPPVVGDVVPTGEGAVVVVPPEPGTVTERPPSTAEALLELGIPARLLMGVTDPAAEVPLSVLVRRFERPPAVRLTRGNVLAVVGPGPAALRVATQMAHRAGLEARDILLAGDVPAAPGHGRRLQTPAALARFRSRVQPDALYLVVIGADDDTERAAALLEAVAPTQAWAVVDARRRGVDLRRWLREVGARRRIDALAAHSTSEAQAPGTVLGLGVPVGWVDGLPAGPLVWAAMLSDRLADDARWD